MPRSNPFNLLEELNRLETLRDPQRKGQRRFTRFLVRADAELVPMDPSHLDRSPLEIKLRDVGHGGLGFICQTPLPRGSAWRVCFLHRGYVVADQGLIVRHCRNVGDGLYLVGGQFCIDTGVLALLGIDPSRVNDDLSVSSDDSDANDFVSPQEVD